ncbi:MAG: hypothetical protein ABIX28_07325 [Vicinamibacterales bacterium]
MSQPGAVACGQVSPEETDSRRGPRAGPFSLETVDGWQGCSEVTLSIPLGAWGALDSAWKNGRQPLLFQRVNTVQTGLAIRF